MPIRHISDTARWVAYFRGLESERTDRLFNDPFAMRLAGERGKAIATEMGLIRIMETSIAVRTRVLDEFILDQIKAGQIDAVVNLAAGLDARAFRLPLPAGFRWVDADLPEILAAKHEILGHEKPRCDYRALPLDLGDLATRRECLLELARQNPRALVLTEGLLVYLEIEQIQSLARDLRESGFKHWAFDFASEEALERLRRRWSAKLRSGNSEMRSGIDPQSLFPPLGWQVARIRATIVEATRMRRWLPMLWLWRWTSRFLADERRRRIERMSGYVLLEVSEARP